MEDHPEDLPRAMEYTFFAANAGKAIDINDLSSPTRTSSMPPVGKLDDKTILIHLATYED
jgi:hypothetical protein